MEKGKITKGQRIVVFVFVMVWVICMWAMLHNDDANEADENSAVGTESTDETDEISFYDNNEYWFALRAD